MGVYLLPSPASLAVFLSSFVTLFVHPQPAIAITRHYKFDVCVTYMTLSKVLKIVQIFSLLLLLLLLLF